MLQIFLKGEGKEREEGTASRKEKPRKERNGKHLENRAEGRKEQGSKLR